MPTPKQEISKYVTTSQMSSGYIDAMDLFNVVRYGAVPGSTESQGARIDTCINAAIAAGSKVVYFPTGTYLTSALSSNADDVAFIGDNASFSSNGSTYTIYQVFSDSSNIQHLYAEASSHASRISALESTVSNIDTRLGVVESTVSNINTRLGVIESTVANIDTRLGVVESTVASHTTSIGFLYAEASSHTTRIDNLETKVNLLQNQGDLLTVTSTGVAVLPIGSSGQLLAVNDGKPTWLDSGSVINSVGNALYLYANVKGGL